MPSSVDICNAALSHIGDSASVSSIDPPDGSVQAAYCAQYYPLALSAILEMSDWAFTTTRSSLAEVTNPSSTWACAYAQPSAAIDIISVLPADATDDNSDLNLYTPQNFALEQDGRGNAIILTNCPDAVLRYKRTVTDTTKFSGLFVMAFSYLLASMLAGPIIKGDAGATKSGQMLKLYQVFVQQAQSFDANQRFTRVLPTTPWMANR